MRERKSKNGKSIAVLVAFGGIWEKFPHDGRSGSSSVVDREKSLNATRIAVGFVGPGPGLVCGE